MMSLQMLGTALTLLVGGVALSIARLEAGDLPRRSVWLVAGGVWLAHGVIQTIQNLWGAWAMVAGSTSRTMSLYLEWAPALNHSRTFLWLAVCFVLVWLTYVKAPPGWAAWMAVVGWLLAGVTAGVAVGLAEGLLVPLRHYSNVAILDATELVVFLATLFVTVLSDRVDRYLWAGLLVWALTVAINVLWYAALSLVDDQRAWSPSPIAMGVYRALLLSLLLSLFARRARLAKLGVEVPGLLGGGRARMLTFRA